MVADLDGPGRSLEFMRSLPLCKNKDEALALAETHIRAFIEERRRAYR